MTVRAAFILFRSGNYFLTLFLFYLILLGLNSVSLISIASIVHIRTNVSDVSNFAIVYILSLKVSPFNE